VFSFPATSSPLVHPLFFCFLIYSINYSFYLSFFHID
jgi:hypothetical protein